MDLIVPFAVAIWTLILLIEQRSTLLKSIAEVKAEVAAKANAVSEAVKATATAKDSQVAAAIQALRDQLAAGVQVSDEDFAELSSLVSGVAPDMVDAVNNIGDSAGINGTQPPADPNVP